MNTDIDIKENSSSILIVDDLPMNLVILSEILKRSGYITHTATDGNSALKAAEEKMPDIILLDIMMPGMDGYEVCRLLKVNKKTHEIPVIFISALTDSETIVKALGFGGVDYITKPFQPEEVTARVKTHIKLYQQSKELHKLNTHLVESQEKLHKFSTHLQTIREEERNLLGTEIHDKIGQILVALKIDMGIWRKKVLYKLENNISNEILENFNELVNIVDNTISTAREITSNLKSDALEILGLIETSKMYCAEYESVYKIDCTLETSISKLEIDEKQKTGLYKILQEALLNIAKRSNVKTVKVKMFLDDNLFVIEIKDNGKIKNEDKIIGNENSGVLNMNERIQLLNGKLIVDNTTVGINIIRIEIPYFNS